MRNQFLTILSLALFVLASCTPLASQSPQATASPLTNVNQPHQITGTFTYTNSIITDYYVEHAVALVDMYGFVQRDREWEIPVSSQTLGFLTIDLENMEGSYILNLPGVPTGQSVDVDNDGSAEEGVQVYAVAYWPNLTGGVYSEGDDHSRGWPNYLASVITDTENKDEVTGGKLVVWSPDAEQQFPTEFGADSLLFTADDPVGPFPAGYSIVDLDSIPFTFSQQPEASLTLYEPKDVAIKDFSSDSYTVAFDKMFDILHKEYAFNGIEGKEPDWDALYAEIRPRVVEAEANQDPNAWYLALRDFTWAFKDGHVSIDAGYYFLADFAAATAGGYGLAIRELDDGRVIVVYLVEGGPADAAGIQLGAEVTAFNGQAIDEAIGNAISYIPQSSDFARRYLQAHFLLRAQPGDQAEITFQNPGGSSQTVTLIAIAELESFSRIFLIFRVDPSPVLPVDFRILDSGIGYVSVNSNYDDLGLIIKLFERALKTFEANQVPGIIIDLRYNFGGAGLGLAGFLTDQEIPIGQLEYYSEASGEFEPEGVRGRVLPKVGQYRFDAMVLLVGQGCFSACELEAYGFSQVPGMIVVGQTPTAGAEAEVARGQFMMPDGFSLQFPTGRFTLPDGSIFLEGQGVQPTVHVPVDETTVFSDEDFVLQKAESIILGE